MAKLRQGALKHTRACSSDSGVNQGVLQLLFAQPGF
jgi:hypothetical protein